MKKNMFLVSVLSLLTIQASAITIDWGGEKHACNGADEIVADIKVGHVLAEVTTLGLPLQIKEAQILSISCNTYDASNTALKVGGTVAVANLGSGYYIAKHLKTSKTSVHGVNLLTLANDFPATKFLPEQLNASIWNQLSDATKRLALAKSSLYENLTRLDSANSSDALTVTQLSMVLARASKEAFAEKSFAQATKLFGEGFLNYEIGSLIQLDGNVVAAAVKVNFVGCTDTKQATAAQSQQLVFKCSGATEVLSREAQIVL